MGRKSKAAEKRLLRLIGVPFVFIGVIGIISGAADLVNHIRTAESWFAIGVGGLFLAIGIGLVRASLATATAKKAGQSGRPAPHQPWDDDDTATTAQAEAAAVTGPIRAEASVDVGAAWMLPVVMGIIILAPVGFHPLAFWAELTQGNPWAIVSSALFLLMLARAIYRSLMFRRYGSPTLELDGGTGYVGETLRGTVIIDRPITALRPATLQVVAKQRVQTTTNDVATTDTSTLLEVTGRIEPAALLRIGQKTRVPFALAIPPDAPISVGRGRLEWELILRVPVAGVDFEQSFPIRMAATRPAVDA